MSFTLPLARHATRRYARSALDPARAGFGDGFVDDAIRWACSEFCDKSQVVRATTDIALAADDPDADFSAITGFGTESVIRARIINNKTSFLVTGSPTGGEYTLTYTYPNDSETSTDPIAYNASAATFQTRWTDAGLVVTASGTAPYVLSFTSDAEHDIGTFALSDNSLTGGTSPSVSISSIGTIRDDLLLKGLQDVLNYRAYSPRARADGVCWTGGIPAIIGFDTATAAQVWPTPSEACTLRVWHWTPFTSFTPGSQGAYSSTVIYYEGDVVSSSGNAYLCIAKTLNNAVSDTAYWTLLGTTTVVPVATPSTTTFNIQDDLMERVLMGAAGKLMEASDDADDKALSAVLISQFNQFVESCRGRGSVGGRS